MKKEELCPVLAPGLGQNKSSPPLLCVTILAIMAKAKTKNASSSGSSSSSLPKVAVIFSMVAAGVALSIQHQIPVLPVLRNFLARREVVPVDYLDQVTHLGPLFANETTILITAKDTCSQSLAVLEDLALQVPTSTAVRVSLPDTAGCKSVLSEEDARSVFPNTVVTYRPRFNPFQAWIDDYSHVKTRYTMLMHNDVYFIDKGGALKMYEAMRQREPHGNKVVVPMIYEREGNVTLSPHAVHADLHLDPTTSPITLGHMMDLKKGLTRWRSQMEEGEQTHFLEDHAFMVHTDFIPSLIDPSSAYTMEYIDMYLNMLHFNGHKPYFTPDSRIEFRVRHDDLSLGDIPYMAGRRSEINALANHRYLEKKWNAQLFFTSAWNYIKFATMRDTHSYNVDAAVPAFVEDRKCFKSLLFFTWFEFIGMNHYNGRRLWTIEKDLCSVEDEFAGDKQVTIMRKTKQEDQVNVPEHWLGRDSKSVLPQKTLEQKPFIIKPRMDYKMYPLLVAAVEYKAEESPADVCGMVVKKADTGIQKCYVFIPPFEYDRENNWYIRLLEKVLGMVKTASRSSVYYSMRNLMRDLTVVADGLKEKAVRPVVTHFCDGVRMGEDYMQSKCEFNVDFDPNDELVKWSGRLHSVDNIMLQLEN